MISSQAINALYYLTNTTTVDLLHPFSSLDHELLLQKKGNGIPAKEDLSTHLVK